MQLQTHHPNNDPNWHNRVPETCDHGRDFLTWYETTDPEQKAFLVDATPHFSYALAVRALKTMRTRAEYRDIPAGYIVVRCSACDVAAEQKDREEHWERYESERRRKLIVALQALNVTTNASALINLDGLGEILSLVRASRISRYDFKEIDERPASFYHGENWHWKLRQLRNREGEMLFEALKANEAWLEEQGVKP